MKRHLLLLIFLLSIITMQGAVKIDKIEPTNWFVGMKNPRLQLMVYGKNIREANVTTDYPGVKIDSIVRLDSPNYLLVYLNLDRVKAGSMILNFNTKGNKTKIKYELKERKIADKDHIGFSNKDVLYMLMPDRFAQGKKRPVIKGMNHYVVDRTSPSLRHGGDLEGIRQHLDYFNQLGVTALWFTPVLENNSPDNNGFRSDRTSPSLRHGGDLEGIRQHLDYFNQLGVTALWFTPVLENNSPDNNGFSTYHGYATTDYYHVDPRFGTNEDYKELIADAHKHGLKVVMDMIFNHCGFEHPWVKDMPSKDWFNTPDWLYGNKSTGKDVTTGLPNGTPDVNDKYLQTSYRLTPIVDPYASKIDKKETVEGWFVPSMPDLNQKNIHVINYLIQNSEWWIETVGIDGIRMDTYPYADFDAMAGWMKTINEEYPNFNVVGETWVTEPAYTATFQKDSRLAKKNSYLNTVMDFSFYDKLSQAKMEETDGAFSGLNRIYNSFVYDYLYTNTSNIMAFIENHDTDRFLADGNDVDMLKQALAMLLTTKRIPQLYYGTEVLMNGTKQITDGNVRKDFVGGCPGDTRSAFTAEGRTAAENDMFNWLSPLLHWRQGNQVISRGTMVQFMPHNGVYVFARQLDGKTVMTVLNGTTRDTSVDFSRYAEVIGGKSVSTDVLTGRQQPLTGNLTLKSRQSMVLEF